MFDTQEYGSVQQEYLQLDDQITSYCWGFRELGIPVAGFIYVEIKKAFPQEPEPNKRQREGRWFSVNKQQTTSYEVYRRTVSENDVIAYESGLYNEFLDWLKENSGDDSYVRRHEVIRNDEELDNAGLYIFQEAAEICNNTLPNFPSPGRFACTGCAFRTPCVAKNRGEDYQYALDTLYEKRDKLYWEERESTTEKRSQ
jgi:hypothetical protein